MAFFVELVDEDVVLLLSLCSGELVTPNLQECLDALARKNVDVNYKHGLALFKAVQHQNLIALEFLINESDIDVTAMRNEAFCLLLKDSDSKNCDFTTSALELFILDRRVLESIEGMIHILSILTENYCFAKLICERVEEEVWERVFAELVKQRLFANACYNLDERYFLPVLQLCFHYCPSLRVYNADAEFCEIVMGCPFKREERRRIGGRRRWEEDGDND